MQSSVQQNTKGVNTKGASVLSLTDCYWHPRETTTTTTTTLTWNFYFLFLFNLIEVFIFLLPYFRGSWRVVSFHESGMDENQYAVSWGIKKL